MADGTSPPDQRNQLARLADYKRSWVGRVGLGLGLVLWLFVSAAGFAAGLANGLAISIVGGAFILGSVWIERSGERHPTFRLVWHLSWRIALGAALVVIAFVNADGWSAALLTAFGALLILPGVAGAALSLRETRLKAVGDDRTRRGRS
jgi:uncharacterized membrane protein HdeD (DUF308 family)